VANRTTTTVEDALVYITVPTLQIHDLLIRWAGMSGGETLDVHPGRHYHTDHFLVAGDNAGQYYLQLVEGQRRIEEGSYAGELCVRGRNVPATTAQIVWGFAPRSVALDIHD
jgi:hypothetical protein